MNRTIDRHALWTIVVMIILFASPSHLRAMENPSMPHVPKRLILCLDGTWASAYDEKKRRDGHTVLKPANPLKMCRAVVPFDETTGRMQVAYYDIGVGALALYPGLSNRLLQRADRILGGGWGAGFEENVENALNFLVLNLEPDDEVFVFGFSRGAATARAVTQFLDWNHGLPEKEDAYYLPRLFRAYVVSHGAQEMQEQELAAINADRAHEKRPLPPLKPFRPVRVKYLGVWDTVMALGSRFESTGASTSTAGRTFYAGTVPAACVDHARQALAIDEHRFDFRPEIWTGRRPHQTMEQRWFAGVHSNIGGGYIDDGLANIAFRWVLKGATAQGLKVSERFVGFYRPFPKDSLYDSYSTVYRILDFVRGRANAGKRSVIGLPVEANSDLDPSVIERMQSAPGDLQPGSDDRPPTQPYRPENVLVFLASQPDLGAYLDSIGVLDGKKIPLPEDVQQRIAELRSRARSQAGAQSGSAGLR